MRGWLEEDVWIKGIAGDITDSGTEIGTNGEMEKPARLKPAGRV